MNVFASAESRLCCCKYLVEYHPKICFKITARLGAAAPGLLFAKKPILISNNSSVNVPAPMVAAYRAFSDLCEYSCTAYSCLRAFI